MIGQYKNHSYLVLARMGKGKTLFAVSECKKFQEKYGIDETLFFGNIHMFKTKRDKLKWLNNPNDKSIHFFDGWEYIPNLVIPFNRIKKLAKDGYKITFIIDDNESLKNSKSMAKNLTNYSRKTGSNLFFTGQYYTQVQKKIRDICEYQVYVNFYEPDDILEFTLTDVQNRIEPFKRKNISRFFDYYDTTEVVNTPTDIDIVNDIIRISDSVKDVQDNLNNFFSATKFRRFFPKICKQLDFDISSIIF